MTTEATPSIMRNEPAEPDTPGGAFVPQPRSIEETGLELSLLVDLALKSVHFSGRPSGRQLSEHLALAFPVIEELVAFLRQEQALEVVGSSGVGEQGYQYALTKRGTEKTARSMRRIRSAESDTSLICFPSPSALRPAWSPLPCPAACPSRRGDPPAASPSTLPTPSNRFNRGPKPGDSERPNRGSTSAAMGRAIRQAIITWY